MKNILKYFSFRIFYPIIVVLSFIIISYYSYQNRKYDTQTITKLKNELIVLENLLDIHLNECNLDNGYSFDSLSVYDEYGVLGSFNKILQGKKLLLFRVSNKHCSICVEEILRFLKLSIKKESIDNVIILGDHSSLREMKVFKSDNDIDFRLYSSSQKLQLHMEKFMNPYFAVIENGIIKYSFLPDKSRPKSIQAFVKNQEKFW